MPHPLDSARERLKRADENIRNLHSEVATFLAPFPVIRLPRTIIKGVAGIDPIFTQAQRDAADALRKKIISTPIDPRFGVLAGEIVHHLRSAFDHVAWQLSSDSYRKTDWRKIEFPVFNTEPTAKEEMSRYARKVKGIGSRTALTRIGSLQPYRRTCPSDHPLWLIHDLDRIDKHREIVLVAQALKVELSSGLIGQGEQHAFELQPRKFRPFFPPQVNVWGQLSAHVTFEKFVGGKSESVIPALQQLLCFASDAIESFSCEFS